MNKIVVFKEEIERLSSLFLRKTFLKGKAKEEIEYKLKMKDKLEKVLSFEEITNLYWSIIMNVNERDFLYMHAQSKFLQLLKQLKDNGHGEIVIK